MVPKGSAEVFAGKEEKMLLAKRLKKVAHLISTAIFTILEVLGLPRIPPDRGIKEEETR